MNYLFFGGLFRLRYAYADLKTETSYVADSLFFRHKVPVKYDQEMANENEKYRIIFCRIRKKDKAEFEKALSEVDNKMCLLGHTDYEAFCHRFMEMTKKKESAIMKKTEAQMDEYGRLDEEEAV